MGRVAKNVAAGVAGNAWTALIHLIFVPIYIRLLGIEAYGLIGVFLTLQLLMSAVDSGLGATVNRELARLSAEGNASREMADLTRTMELVYCVIAVGVTAAIVAASSVLATHWIRAESLPRDTVHLAVLWMAAAIGAQFLISLYTGALFGMQRQVEANVITATTMTLRAFVAVAALLTIGRSIVVFFAWQVIATLLHAFALRYALWRALPPVERPQFQPELLRRTRRFATGTTAMVVLTLVLTQTDKLLLSHLLTLSVFGYYSLAWIVASMTYRLTGPVSQALYPRLTQLVATDDRAQLVRTYHQASQLMTVLVFPPSLLLAIFPREIIGLWTRDANAVAATHTILMVLAIGCALNAMMYIPYGLQFAHGLTSLSVKANLVAVALQVPLVILLTKRYGALGGASVWLALNVGFVLILGILMNGRFLPGERWRWLGADVLLPAMASLLPIAAGRLLVGPGLSRIVLFLAIAVVGSLSAAAALLAAPDLRRVLRSYLTGRWSPAWRA